MRPSGDYLGEMPTTNVLDREIELLLAGTPIEGGRLSGLTPVMAMIRVNGRQCHPSRKSPNSREVPWQKSKCRSPLPQPSPLSGDSGGPASGVSPRVWQQWRWASFSCPGQPARPSWLPTAPFPVTPYTVSIADSSGWASARAQQTNGSMKQWVIAAQGRSDEAVAHAIEALGGHSEDQYAVALTALTVASENLVHAQDTAQAAATVNIRVSALLTYIAENIGPDRGTDGREFGQGSPNSPGTSAGATIQTGPKTRPSPRPPARDSRATRVLVPGIRGRTKDPLPGNGSSNGNGQDNGPPAESPSVTAPGQDNGPPAESPSVTAPGQDNGPPAESPSVTAPSRGTNTEDSPAATAPGKENKP